MAVKPSGSSGVYLNLNHLAVAELTIVFCLVSGCGSREIPALPSTAATVSTVASTTTIEHVRKIVSEQMGVSIDKIQSTTSLGDLGADELDFVELIMELEESFSIAIPDGAAEMKEVNQNWREGIKNVTIQRLSTLMDELTKSKPDNAVNANGE